MNFWEDSWTDYAIKIARVYKQYPEEILCCLHLSSVPGCLSESYKTLVKNKTIAPLEQLSPSQKTRLWNQSLQYSTEKNHRISVSQSLYLLEQLCDK